MPYDERQPGNAGKLFPVAFSNVQVRVAYATGFHLDQDFAFAGDGALHFLNHHGLF
jgi:hypothetical protein